LSTFEGSVDAPTYDRSAISGGIVHLGVGGFHRAHLATYADELCEAGHTMWGIVGCGVLPGDAAMADALLPQDCLYTLVVRGGDSTSLRIIGSLVDYLHAHPDTSDVIARIASPEIQIVSLTITEGGYPVDDNTGAYEASSPNAGPDSAFGIIAAGLEARRQADAGPITIMSCDNILSNGHVAQAATLGEADRYGDDLAAWISSSVSFPNSMVDRITPATADLDRSWLSETHGIEDAWPVITEPFRQWVIEDNFAGARLPLEELDIIVTHDVEPYEFMKLRLLNAGHSCMAYLSALMGIDTVDKAMANPSIDEYLLHFLHDEAKPVLPDVAGIDIDDYIATLVERFRNPAIGDQIARLCLDGSAKFPKFLLPTVRAQLSAGGSAPLSALALAGWCQYLLGTDEHGASIAISEDPNLADAVAHAKASETDPAAFLQFGAVFDNEIAESENFRAAFTHALELLRSTGAAAAIATTLQPGNGQSNAHG
jgi:mannitol 2-dehydrogenase